MHMKHTIVLLAIESITSHNSRVNNEVIKSSLKEFVDANDVG